MEYTPQFVMGRRAAGRSNFIIRALIEFIDKRLVDSRFAKKRPKNLNLDAPSVVGDLAWV